MDANLGSISGLLRQAREETTLEVAASAAVKAVEAANAKVEERVYHEEEERAAETMPARSRLHSTRYTAGASAGPAGLDAENTAKVEKLLGMIDSSLQELRTEAHPNRGALSSSASKSKGGSPRQPHLKSVPHTSVSLLDPAGDQVSKLDGDEEQKPEREQEGHTDAKVTAAQYPVTHHVTSDQLLLGGEGSSSLRVNFNDLTINSITAELLRWQSQCGSLKKENSQLRRMLQYSVSVSPVVLEQKSRSRTNGLSGTF